MKHSGEEVIYKHGAKFTHLKIVPWAGAAVWEERVVLAGNDGADSDHCDQEPRGEAPASYPGVQDVLDGPGVRGDQGALLASYPDDPGDLASVWASPSLGWASCRAGDWAWRDPGCQAHLFSMPVGNLKQLICW